MRQALNNLQSTKEGFGFVNSENVFKVVLSFSFCDFVLRMGLRKLYIYYKVDHNFLVTFSVKVAPLLNDRKVRRLVNTHIDFLTRI